jgi:hypothetical protein
MDISTQKEQFNMAYLCALAAHAGLKSSKPVVDDDSVDLQINGKGFRGRRRNPFIELQLKCTSQDFVVGDVIKFPLPIKNYNDLRGRDVSAPRYLAVLLVPEEPIGWIQHHAEHMSLHNTCYWVSIRDEPDTTNTTSVTVNVPLSQRLTTEALLTLLTLASNEDEP